MTLYRSIDLTDARSVSGWTFRELQRWEYPRPSMSVVAEMDMKEISPQEVLRGIYQWNNDEAVMFKASHVDGMGGVIKLWVECGRSVPTVDGSADGGGDTGGAE